MEFTNKGRTCTRRDRAKNLFNWPAVSLISTARLAIENRLVTSNTDTSRLITRRLQGGWVEIYRDCYIAAQYPISNK